MNSPDYSYLLGPLHAYLSHMHVTKTKARDLLFLSLYHQGPCTRREILTRNPAFSKVSLYKNLRLFQRIDVVKQIDPGLFEITDRFKQHHHHMRCRICKKASPFYDESLEKALMKSFSGTGFALEDHQLSVSGICPDCKRDPQNRPQPAIGTRLRRYILQT